MKEGWKYERLSDACSVFTDGNWIESKDQSDEGIRLVQTGNIGFGYFKDKDDKARYISEETFVRLKCTEILAGDLLVSRLPDPVGKSCIIPELNTKMITGVDCTIVRPKDYLTSQFLCFYQQSDEYLKAVQKLVSGTTRSRISRKNLGLIPIPIPPLPEQERIVAQLDAAFAAIDKAKANVERNLHNAKELFQSKLNEVFSGEKEGWVEKRLGECIRLKSGDGLTAKAMMQGPYPVYGGNGIAGQHHKYNLDGNHVIIGRVGALCGNARFINEPIWLTDNAFLVSDYLVEFNREFLTLLLNFRDLRSYARQTAQPVVSNSSMKDVPLTYPTDIKEQERIVKQMNQLREAMDSLSERYMNKLTELETLKKSVLERAFRGEI
jgi:type I restriction enzyme, S subunit